MSTWTSAAWGSEVFLAELRDFVTAAVGPPDRMERLQQRPWSVVWRVEAAGVVAYAKQNCPGQSHEARLVQALAGVAPELVVPVLAADTDRDLLLTGRLGPPVVETTGGDLDLWCRIVAAAAELQRCAVDALADVGLTILAPGDATTYVADAVGRLAALPEDDPRRVPAETAARLQGLLPTISRWADEVEDLDLPLTLLHNDLHTHNVVAVGGTLRFFDFGDAVAGDPLGNLLIPLRFAGAELDAGPDDARLWRIAEAALEVWSDRAPLRDLRAALPASLQLARLARVESWRRCVATMTAEERAEFGSAPAGWLATLADAPPLGALVPIRVTPDGAVAQSVRAEDS